MPETQFSEGDEVTISGVDLYEGSSAEVVSVGEDAAGEAVVVVKVEDPTTGREVHAGFSPENIERGEG